MPQTRSHCSEACPLMLEGRQLRKPGRRPCPRPPRCRCGQRAHRHRSRSPEPPSGYLMTLKRHSKLNTGLGSQALFWLIVPPTAMLRSRGPSGSSATNPKQLTTIRLIMSPTDSTTASRAPLDRSCFAQRCSALTASSYSQTCSFRVICWEFWRETIVSTLPTL